MPAVCVAPDAPSRGRNAAATAPLVMLLPLTWPLMVVALIVPALIVPALNDCGLNSYVVPRTPMSRTLDCG